MADNDPISSDSTPNKRRRLNNNCKGWDSDEDNDADFNVDDFEPATVATVPLPPQQKMHYTAQQFHSDLRSNSSIYARQSSPSTYFTQPTQNMNQYTQPTQPLPQKGPPAQSSDILVDRSSPPESPQKPPPQPIKKAFSNSKPGGLLASAMAPPGTTFRQPLGFSSSKPIQPQPIDSDNFSDDDPPVYHSSDDEETQGRSNLKPTNFKKGGRGLDSTPNRESIVKESPRPAAQTNGGFGSLMKEFGFNTSSSDSVSAYANSSRRPRQDIQRQPSASKNMNSNNAIIYNSLEDIDDFTLRRKVREILQISPHESVQRCVDALVRNKGNVQDASNWLYEDEEQDAPGEDDDVDELAAASPVVRRGVAVSRPSQSSQPIRPAAKQEVNLPSLKIAEKYGSTQQAARRPSQPVTNLDQESPIDERVKPRKRLLQGRKVATRSPSPPSSPLHKQSPPQEPSKQVITIDDDDSESDSGVGRDSEEAQIAATTNFNVRLLKFFNECSVQDLADLSAQPQDVVKFLLDRRPFQSLDEIREVTNVTQTKSGKKSRSKPVGDKVVDLCSEMWTGYDAVDELVEECERIAKPIQDALKSWGVSGDDGELQLMNLDEAHDSGIGTPASTYADEPVPRASKQSRSSKSRFLSQPGSMNSETTLKDYQLVGLNWLNLLWSKKISCILADDMGLGKTCQVISFLAHLQEQHVDGVHLVIVPGSTLENWLREFANFAPDLSVFPYYGGQNERVAMQERFMDESDTIDVVVTTYDMAVKPDDNKFLRLRVNPVVCVYDEAHALRNPKSTRYQQLTRIRSQFRVLLTGTPLQNNLQELVAILAFIMPDLFAEKRDDLEYIFQHKASTKDTGNTALLSAQRIARARTMMTPFILRRKKHQVLDLPTKHSRVEYCEMTSTQSKYYNQLLGEFQDFLANKDKAKKGTARASSNMLMALRKAAIHPLLARRLFDDAKIEKMTTLLLKHHFTNNREDQVREFLTGDRHDGIKGGDYALHCYCSDPDRTYLHKFMLKKKPWMDSGKVEKFKELITGFAANGDRVLVFSQFTTMMDVLEAVLQSLDIKFMRLDGSTDMQIRQSMLDHFTNDDSIPVFMLSTKAGGAGINLATANKVIIFDSGFNPQEDIQAENRAHRVGQTREVEVVRLVTRGTIEEQIHALGESKLALDERVAGEGATAADEIKAEKAGEQVVEQMLLDDLNKQVEKDDPATTSGSTDLKDAFKNGLEKAGLNVASKQAVF